MINSDTIPEIWMLKRKKVTRSLSWHQYSAARELFVTFGFIDNFLYVSFITFIHHKQTFKGFQTCFLASVQYLHLIVSYNCLLKNRLNLLIRFNFCPRSANRFKVVIKLCRYWDFTPLNMFTQVCLGIKRPKTIEYDYNSYSTFYLWSALQTLTN